MEKIRKRNIGVFFWLLVVSSALLLKYSTSSPLYFMNLWVDTNANMTVARGILNGIVPYRDLFEQRGPWLYFIYALCSMIKGSTSFFGVYLYEVFCTAVFLFVSWKLLKVYSEASSQLFVITSPIFLWLLLRAPSFGLGGSPEELCLPALSITFYILLKSLHDDRTLTFRQGIWIGLCAGYVFWIKYNMIGFFAGGGIVSLAAYAEKSQWKEIRNVLLGVFSGVGIMTLPVMIYFASNHALADLFRVYFYDNIFYYSYKPYLINKLYYCAHNLVHSVRDNPALWMMIAAGLCWFTIRLKDKKEFLFLLITGMIDVFFVYQGGRDYVYYAYCFAIYAPTVYLWFDRPFPSTKVQGILAIVVIVLAFIPSFQTFTAHRSADRSQLVQYRFTDQMKKDSVLLTYNQIDMGYYNAGDLKPALYYSWAPNLLRDEIRDVQDQYIRDQRPDYIVSSAEISDEVLAGNYTLIDSYGDQYLYKKKQS